MNDTLQVPGSDATDTKRNNMHMLAQDLKKTLDRRSRMDRMNAVDEEDDDEADNTNLRDKNTITSQFASQTITTDTNHHHLHYNHQNNNNNCLPEDSEQKLLGCIKDNDTNNSSSTESSTVKSMISPGATFNDINYTSTGTEIIRHKPPKYPVLLPTSLPSTFVKETESKQALKTQYSKDDPFSADFEDAIGDTFVEDAELEWDHSPDTDINEDLELDMMMITPVKEEEVELDLLPLPPPPQLLNGVIDDDCLNLTGNDSDGEPPLPPPPPDIDDISGIDLSSCLDVEDAPPSQQIGSYNFEANPDTNQNIMFMPTPMALMPNLADVLRTGTNSDNTICSPSRIKETAIDGDLDIITGTGICVAVSENEHITKSAFNSDQRSHHSHCRGLCDSCIGLQSALITETPVLGNSDISVSSNSGSDNAVVVVENGHGSYNKNISSKQKPNIPLDVNVITLTNNAVQQGKDQQDTLPLTFQTVVRPKSHTMKPKRNYYEHDALDSKSYCNDDSVLPKIHGSLKPGHFEERKAQVMDSLVKSAQRSSAPPLSLQIYPRPKQLREEMSIEDNTDVILEDGLLPNLNVTITDTCTIPKSPIMSPKKHSPGGGSGKRVLFQLPNGHHHSDGEEEKVVNMDISEVQQPQLVVERHSIHGGLMHSSSSDALLKSPRTLQSSGPDGINSVRLRGSEADPYIIDIDSNIKHKFNHSLTNTTFKTLPPPSVLIDKVSKDPNRHSTPPVLYAQTSSSSLKSQHLLSPNKTSSSRKADGGSKKVRKTKTEHSAESEDSYFSDSDFDDDYDDVYNIDDDGMSSTSDFTSYSDEAVPRSPRGGSIELDSAYDVVAEILKTEKAYVDRLHFLCRVVLLNIKVLNNVQEIHIIPPEALAKIFCNVEKIFSLHSSTVLPLLDERLANWKFCSRLDDVMRDLIPHFGLYHEFVENFNIAMTAMSLWMEKCPVFQRLILEVEKTPECRRLKVKQHLLEIVHRVPTYYDLLRSYSSHVQEGSPEKESIKDIIAALNELVNELDRELGKTDRIKRLKAVQQKLDNTSVKFNVVSPLRQLVKEGKIKSISSKTGKKLDRYLFLMDDMLLICTSSGLGSKHKLKFTLGVDRMQIHDSDNLVIPFTFYVQSKTRAIEFHCVSQEDKQCWVSTLQTVIDEYAKKKLLSQPVTVIQKTISEDEIGKVAPKIEHPQGQAVCYICKVVMKKISNCKGCGQVVCNKCSSHKIKLQYDSNKINKVCDECFVLVSNRDLIESTATFDIPCVRPSDPCIIAGYLQLSFNKGNTWHKRWLTLHNTAVMYSFKNFKEPTVLGSLPLKRFTTCPTNKGDDVNKTTTFKVFNARRTYYMQADNADAMARWIDALADLTDSKA